MPSSLFGLRPPATAYDWEFVAERETQQYPIVAQVTLRGEPIGWLCLSSVDDCWHAVTLTNRQHRTPFPSFIDGCWWLTRAEAVQLIAQETEATFVEEDDAETLV